MVALLVALLLHAFLAVGIVRAPVRVFPSPTQQRVELVVLPTPPTPPTPPTQTTTPSIPPTPPPLDKKPPRSPTVTPTAKTTTPTPTPPTNAPSPQSPASTPPNDNASSVMPTLPGTTSLGGVFGGPGGLMPSLSTLERSLDGPSTGPRTDGQRAQQTAVQNLQRDFADDIVTSGLADDYFRLLRLQIERAWQPAKNDLNDGGASATQVGLSKAFATDMSAWNELWSAYLDVAKQYANGVQPQLEPARKARLIETMRSRKGMFRIQAISEFSLTLDPSGKIQLLQNTLGSGHPRIDAAMSDAIVNAARAMPDKPPSRITQGRSFTSSWRLRATWTMVPPTAFLSGAGFDITSKGVDIDIPFEIKLQTNVQLLRTDVNTSANVHTTE
jgi:hypothetical protein